MAQRTVEHYSSTMRSSRPLSPVPWLACGFLALSGLAACRADGQPREMGAVAIGRCAEETPIDVDAPSAPGGDRTAEDVVEDANALFVSVVVSFTEREAGGELASAPVHDESFAVVFSGLQEASELHDPEGDCGGDALMAFTHVAVSGSLVGEGRAYLMATADGRVLPELQATVAPSVALDDAIRVRFPDYTSLTLNTEATTGPSAYEGLDISLLVTTGHSTTVFATCDATGAGCAAFPMADTAPLPWDGAE